MESRGRMRRWAGAGLWTAAVVGAFFYHYTFPWYHAEKSPWYCPTFALIPFGAAWAAGLLLGAIWRQPTPLWRKAALTLAVLAVAVPVVWGSGFLWLVTHMAP